MNGSQGSYTASNFSKRCLTPFSTTRAPKRVPDTFFSNQRLKTMPVTFSQQPTTQKGACHLFSASFITTY